jgi:CheY-like chemotaxis protein
MTLKPEHDRLTKMLVVDDHTISGQHALAALRQCPGEVRWVSTASAAVETALCWHPHIIFMDRHLPGSDGLELLDRIQAEWPSDRSLPKFVVMTGDGSALAAAAIEATQVAHVLVKPVSGRKIRAAAGLAVSREIKESTAAGTGVELRAMFRSELEQRLPELDSSLCVLNSEAAAGILHQLIASAAMCLESRLESSLRSLDAACRQGAQPGEIARRYHVMLEFAREFIARTAPR